MGILRPWRVQRGTSPGSTPPPRPPRSSSSIPRTGGWCGRPAVRTRTARRSIPRAWWDALAGALGEVGTDDVAAIGVAGQQHGMVLLDEHGEPVRDALLWNDTRSAPDATALIEELGGRRRVGRGGRHRPGREHHRHQAALDLPRRAGRRRPRAPGPASARLADLAAARLPRRRDHRPRRRLGHRLLVDGHRRVPPRPARDGVRAGARGAAGRGAGRGRRATRRTGSRSSAGTGDNAGAALAIGPAEGEVVVSIGTSGAVFTGHDRPSTDASGLVAGFADARGGYLPLRRDPQRRPGARGRRGAAGRGSGRVRRAWPAPPRPGRTGWCCCPTSTASAPPTARTPRAATSG